MIQHVAVAIDEVGIKEATGRNDGTPSYRYQRDPYVEGQLCREVSWCGLFVMWVFDQVDFGPKLHHTRQQWYRFAGVANLFDHWQGCLIDLEDDGPEPGDLIVLNDRGQSDPGVGGWHIGIVMATTENRVVSIDGNWRNQVALVARERDNPKILGYLRIR